MGSGWAAHALVKIIDADLYRLLVVSPRNFFIFTPMLAASSVGTVEYRSITEPMRGANPRAAFIEGSVTALDPVARTVTLAIGGQDTEARAEARSLNYDLAVYACGVASAARVPGVAEHCLFLKVWEQGPPNAPMLASQLTAKPCLSSPSQELQDAQRLRRAVGNALERASQPGLSEAER